MICITLSVHVLSDFIRFHSSSEATRSFFIVGESCWWVMCFPLSLHIAWHGWNNNTSTTGEKNLKDIVRTCQNTLTLCNWAHFFLTPVETPSSTDSAARALPTYGFPPSPSWAHTRVRSASSRALLWMGMKISDCTSWYDRTNHKTKRWGSPRIGPTPEKVQGSRNQKMIMIRAKGRMLRHSVWWSNRGSYGSVWTDASKRDTATSPPAWTPTETGCFFLVLLGLAFPR